MENDGRTPTINYNFCSFLVDFLDDLRKMMSYRFLGSRFFLGKPDSFAGSGMGKKEVRFEANDHIPSPDFRGKSFRKMMIDSAGESRDLLTLARTWERFDVGVRNHQPLGGCQVA